MTSFIHGEMWQCVRDEFSIIFTDTYAVSLFGDTLKLSHIEMVSQEHHRPHLILNLPAQPDEGTPGVNDTTDREVVLESIKFGRAFPRTLQAICEEDLDKVPVRVS